MGARLRGHRLEAARLPASLRPGQALRKIKHPAALAVKPEAEEDWGAKRWGAVAARWLNP
jgi:hypothetical protein